MFAGFGITDMIEAFASFDFTNLYGKGGSADFRTLVLGVNFRLLTTFPRSGARGRVQ